MKFKVLMVISLIANTTWGFYGADDFSGMSMDENKWEKGTTHENVTFDLDGAGKLIFNTDTGGHEYWGRWHWNQVGSHAQSWTVELEVGTLLSNLVDATGAWIGLSLGTINEDGKYKYGVELGLEVSAYAGVNYRGVFFDAWADEDEDDGYHAVTADHVLLSLSYDPVGNLLTASCIEEGEERVELYVYDLTPWESVMNEGFFLMLKADSQDVAIADGEMFATNFNAIPEPGTVGMVGLGLLAIAMRRRIRPMKP